MLCFPGNIVGREEPHSVDRQAAHIRQRDYMDLESATLAMIIDVVRLQQCLQSPATTRIKRNPIRTAPASIPAPLAAHTSILAPAAGSSTIRPPQPNSRELDIITKISRGEGVSSYECLGLLEECGICKMYFTGTVLCRHIFKCSCSPF